MFLCNSVLDGYTQMFIQCATCRVLMSTQVFNVFHKHVVYPLQPKVGGSFCSHDTTRLCMLKFSCRFKDRNVVGGASDSIRSVDSVDVSETSTHVQKY